MLFSEPNDAQAMENIDNLTVAPWGDLVCAEDAGGGQELPGNRIVGVARDGRCYPVAFNALNAGEFAGTCFSPDGKWLFANIFHPGHTVAITGPWSG
jgi:secreted PhoX family phosphatase